MLLKMYKYLNWLSEKINYRPFTLILDQYPSNVDEGVVISAKSLGINLIYIPAGATGLLQPLDRRVFGVLKSQNRKDQRLTEVPLDTTRFSYIYEQTLKNFNSICDQYISSSFRGIPGLKSYLPSSSSDTECDYDGSYFLDGSDDSDRI